MVAKAMDAVFLGVEPASRLGAALAILRGHDVALPASRDGVATALMDLYRTTGADRVFEALIALCRNQLLQRVRSRTLFLGGRVDAEELLQDAVINIYRYPARFDGRRPGAFRAWSSTIVDNAVRRHMRRSTSGLVIRLQPTELLAEEPDRQHQGPSETAIAAEDLERTAAAFRLLLSYYLAAYQRLNERERFVLQMVEVEGQRYAQIGETLGMRPEALKMVVFRARKRLFARVSAMMSSGVEIVRGRGRQQEPPRRFGRSSGLKVAV